LTYTSISKNIKVLMDEIEDYYLPAIQREFVWSSDQIEGLFDSLIRGYPIGTLLFWKVREPAVHEAQFYELVRNFDERKAHNVKANMDGKTKCVGILDGQQRITALLIGLKGSYTQRVPRMHRTNPNAYPETKLFIDLLHAPDPDEPGAQYKVRFLKDGEGQQTGDAYWFRVGEVLNFQDVDNLREYVRKSGHKDNTTFEDNLYRLYRAVNEENAITYFEESRQDLDAVLEIFVRLNRGGTPLSYSDLLLSMATASWKGRDARELVYKLVEDLNHYGAGFQFDKDLILKVLLVFNGKDIRFRTRNFSIQSGLEKQWDAVERYLKLTVLLISGFGFDRDTLVSNNAIIPIAYYLAKRGADPSYLTSTKATQDREKIRSWLIRTLLGRVFGAQSDGILTRTRTVIDSAKATAADRIDFPASELNKELRQTEFTRELTEGLINETAYGDPRAFLVLALLNPQLDLRTNQFHLDHIHPKSYFEARKLRAAGMAEDAVEFALSHYNGLPNLQLLLGPLNEAKGNTPFELWLGNQKDPELFKSQSDIPDCSLSLKDFRDFYEKRAALLQQKLSGILNVAPSHSSAT
jgi:hypothetical protein